MPYPMSNPSLLEIDRGTGTLISSSRIPARHAGEEAKSIKHFLFQIHGILLTVGFTVLMPFGVAIIRSGAKQAFKLHWIVQLIGVGMCSAGMAIAMIISKTLFQFGNAHGTHKGIGLVLLISIILQPALGYWHHVAYVRLKRRTSVSYWHIYLGRGLIVLAWLNIALGLYIGHVPLYIVVPWLVLLSMSAYVMVRPGFIARYLSDEKSTRTAQEYELVEDDERGEGGFVRQRAGATSWGRTFLRRLFG